MTVVWKSGLMYNNALMQPPSFRLRPAVEADSPAIKTLIRKVQINPMGLDWRHFLIAVDDHDALVGCGQLKPHRDGTIELASIAVEPEWRDQGIASAIIRRLIDQYDGTLYLTCRGIMGPFYERFGFSVKGVDESRQSRDTQSPYFRRIARIAAFIQKTGLIQDKLLVMKRG
jgi:N-acetylglutamate synthase-like GNAT family acetyltransferase